MNGCSHNLGRPANPWVVPLSFVPVTEVVRSAAVRPPSTALRGIAFKVASVLIFLVMSSLLKASEGIPPGEMVFFRSFFGIPPVLVVIALRGEMRGALQTRSVTGQVLRGIVGTFSMACGFYALTVLPLPEAITLNYATPLVIVVFGAVFAHETVRLYRWSAVLVGLVGVVIIAWPQLTLINRGVAGPEVLGVLATLAACCFSAWAMLLVRTLVQVEKSVTIVLYFLMASSVIALVSLPFGWVMPTPLQAVYLVGAGITGGLAQILLTESYRHAEMSVVAPFEYSSLIFSVAIGYVFFGDVPTVYMLVGGLIVVASGLFIIFREHRLGLDRKAAREVSTPQG
jgi:drug/metabolite transporter (DMT)-like permease